MKNIEFIKELLELPMEAEVCISEQRENRDWDTRKAETVMDNGDGTIGILSRGKRILSAPKYELTDSGKAKCELYLHEMKAKRKEILDAGLDTADDVTLPTVEEMFEDLIDNSIDEDGDIYDCFGVTDNYDADSMLILRLFEDFVLSDAVEEEIKNE